MEKAEAEKVQVVKAAEGTAAIVPSAHRSLNVAMLDAMHTMKSLRPELHLRINTSPPISCACRACKESLACATTGMRCPGVSEMRSPRCLRLRR